MQYKVNAPVSALEVADVFKRSGIKRPVDDLERIQRMIDNADEIITAWDGETLIGVARAVTDYSYCCYLSDLAVDHKYQGHGIGRELVKILRDKLGEEVSYVLTSAPDAVEFYPRIGFEKAEKAFLIRRKR